MTFNVWSANHRDAGLPTLDGFSSSLGRNKQGFVTSTVPSTEFVTIQVQVRARSFRSVSIDLSHHNILRRHNRSRLPFAGRDHPALIPLKTSCFGGILICLLAPAWRNWYLNCTRSRKSTLRPQALKA